MRSASIRSAVSLLIAAILMIVGCQSEPDPGTKSTVTTSGGNKGGTEAAADSKATTSKKSDSNTKPIEDWEPTSGLFLTGQADNHLYPCGCTENQRGGMPRRLDLKEKLIAKGWSFACLDLGGLLRDPTSSLGGPGQAKIKFAVGLQALSAMKYSAMSLNPEDLKLGLNEAFGAIVNIENAPKLLATNLIPKDGFVFKDLNLVVPTIIVQSGKKKIGVASIVNPDEWKKLSDPERDSSFEVKDPKEILSSTLADLEKQSDLQVLLINGGFRGGADKDPDSLSVRMAKELAPLVTGFDVIVASSETSDPDPEPIMLNDGKTMLAAVGRKGIYVGLIGIYDQEPKLRYIRIALDKTYDKFKEPIHKLLEEDYQEQLKAEGVVENFVKRGHLESPEGSTYVGAATCQKCHPATFNRWASTKHSHGYDSIVKDPKEPQRRSHAFDAECVTCHTTGFEYKTGWVSAEKTAHLKGNQCENCHGPGSKHSAEPDNADYRKAIKRSIDVFRNSHTCNRCHDEDNSPKFNFETFWDSVKHNKMDVYDSPEVHKGVKVP